MGKEIKSPLQTWDDKSDTKWLQRTEKKLDKCNHIMELMRTCLGLLTLALQVLILLKLFGII